MAVDMVFSRFVPVAVLLMAMVAGVRSATIGNVTNFTVNGNSSLYVRVSEGMKLQLVCRAVYNASTPPVVRMKKVDFTNRTWQLSENDGWASVDDDQPPEGWTFEATDPSLLPPKTVEYTVTIYPVKNGDSGNYSCNAGVSAKNRTTVDVITEATAAAMTFNGLPVTMGQNIQVTIGQQYPVTCNISGGNPFPSVNISTSKGQITPTFTTTNWTAMFSAINVGYIRRATNATASIVFDASMLGKQVICAGGLNNPAAVSTYFIPTSDAVVPQFKCDDKVMFPNNVATLVITCQVYAPNLTSSYVRWVNSTKSNNTITGAVGRTITFPNDQRYTLLVTPPPAIPGNNWYTMTLTVSQGHNIKDLGTISYQFVAANSKGQSLHSVTVQLDSLKSPVGGASQNVLSTVGYLVTLLIAAVAAAVMM